MTSWHNQIIYRTKHRAFQGDKAVEDHNNESNLPCIRMVVAFGTISSQAYGGDVKVVCGIASIDAVAS